MTFAERELMITSAGTLKNFAIRGGTRAGDRRISCPPKKGWGNVATPLPK
jgi:hypothetical protein